MVNSGIAFGLWPGLPSWVVGISLLVVIGIAVKTRELSERVSLTLIIVGGAMNLSQRIVYGWVIDPWQVVGVGYNNLADYLIFFGLVGYGYTYYLRRRGARRN